MKMHTGHVDDCAICFLANENERLREGLERIKAFAENLSCELTGMSECDHDNCCATSQLRAVIRNSRDGNEESK